MGEKKDSSRASYTVQHTRSYIVNTVEWRSKRWDRNINYSYRFKRLKRNLIKKNTKGKDSQKSEIPSTTK